MADQYDRVYLLVPPRPSQVTGYVGTLWSLVREDMADDQDRQTAAKRIVPMRPRSKGLDVREVNREQSA